MAVHTHSSVAGFRFVNLNRKSSVLPRVNVPILPKGGATVAVGGNSSNPAMSDNSNALQPVKRFVTATLENIDAKKENRFEEQTVKATKLSGNLIRFASYNSHSGEAGEVLYQ